MITAFVAAGFGWGYHVGHDDGHIEGYHDGYDEGAADGDPIFRQQAVQTAVDNLIQEWLS